MTRRLRRFVAASASAALCCAIAAASLLLPAGHVRSTDKNGDGRPDVWQTYDRQGQLSEVATDTNYDGRVDRREFYERGALVRRESDRDFNDRVDLVQEFDPVTRQPVRTVADVDSDGVADLLVLFRGGKVVLSKWSHPPAPPARVVPAAFTSRGPQRAADNQLAPLLDPFLADLSLSAMQLPGSAGDAVILSVSSTLPARESTPLVLDAASAAPETSAIRLTPEIASSTSPRGPPASSLLA